MARDGGKETGRTGEESFCVTK
jgi:hypothetical protein